MEEVQKSALFLKASPESRFWIINRAAESRHLPMFRAVGRVLGLMFARGFPLAGFAFEYTFYAYLVDEQPSLDAISEDYPSEHAFLKEMRNNPWDRKTFRDRRKQITWEDLDAGEVQQMENEKKQIWTQYFWMKDTAASRTKCEYLAWIEQMIRHYALERMGPGHEEMKGGFWEVVPMSLKKEISGSLLRAVLTRST